MPTLVLPPRYTIDTNQIRKAAINRGWAIERLSSWAVPDSLRDQEPVLYGEPLFAAVIANSLGLALLEPPLDWLVSIPTELLQREVRFMTLDQARHEKQVFIKPADDKCFIARVYENGEELPDSSVLPDDTPVLVSEPVKWSLEFRCFILEHQAITLSPYLREGELCQADDGAWPASEQEFAEAEEFLRYCLADARVRIPPAVVVDVGVISGVGWAIIEANAAWGSGIYGCDPDKVLDVIQRSCVQQHSLTAVDHEWLIERT